jgi:pyruvate/2-oxoglutarate dehydrogenase complex dihydrolipoamide acyltransferase (E2) component
MNGNNDGYTVQPFPRIRLPMVDGGQMGRRRHTVHGLVEFDVTLARQAIRQHKQATGETLSFTAFVVACLGKSIDLNRHMHAYRDWRNQLVIFDDVDVNTLFEVEREGVKTIRPHILRSVNKKSFQELHQEIRTFQQEHQGSQEAKFIEWFVLLPGFLRRLFYLALFKNPHRLKQYYGTVMMTAVGMFGTGSGWGIPVPNHTLQLTLGGIAQKPGVVAGQIQAREYLCVTISIDHDIIDGAPAARFTQRLQALIEAGYGLLDTPG